MGGSLKVLVSPSAMAGGAERKRRDAAMVRAVGPTELVGVLEAWSLKEARGGKIE